MKAGDYWKSDLLGRRQDAEFLYNFLVGEIAKRKSQGRTSSYVLNVDAEWGGGKTFFLDGMALDLEERGHIVARINAWRDDHASDPYVAIMAAIDKAFEPHIKEPGRIEKTWAAAKKSGGPIAMRIGAAVGKALLKKHTGVSVDEIVDIVGGAAGGEGEPGVLVGAIEAGANEAGKELEKLFDSSLEALIEGFKHTDQAMVDFRQKLENAVAAVADKRSAPLFILVDELDRCRPTYAIQLLERVKHLFEVDGVIFVFATNSAQLQHSVAGAYGANFDGLRYLRRFFDRTYAFQEPSTLALIERLLADVPREKIRAPENALTEVLSNGFKCFGFDLRAIRQIIEMIDAAATAWPHKPRIDIALLFPVCAHLYATQRAEWPTAPYSPLNNWVLSRSYRPRYEQKTVDRSVNLGEAYWQATSRFGSMDEIMHAPRRSNENPTEEYVHGIFEPEWNGISVERSQPSVQTKILDLVANVGRLVDANRPE